MPTGPARAPTLAVLTVFAVAGFGFANWITRLPTVKASLGLSEGTLGLALLAMAVGALIAMPAGGALAARFGSARLCMLSGLAYAACWVLPAAAPNAWVLAAGLFVAGFANGAIDVSMNTQADAIERRYGVRIMSLCHAGFSAGLALGVVPGGLFAAADVAPWAHLTLVGLGLAGIVLAASRYHVPDAARAGGDPLFAWPRGPLLWLGLVCVCGAIVEGAMNDWITVYVVSLGRGEASAAIGFGLFSAAMLLGRLYGDAIIDALGSVLAVRAGMALAAVGLLCAASGWEGVMPFGFFAVGLGVAGIFPSVFRAAARVPGHPPGPSMAAAVTLGYTGFLAGPPLIGFVAEVSSLSVSFLLLVPLCLAAIGMAGVLSHGDRAD